MKPFTYERAQSPAEAAASARELQARNSLQAAPICSI